MSLPPYQEATRKLSAKPCVQAKSPAIAMMIGLAVGGLHTVAGSAAFYKHLKSLPVKSSRVDFLEDTFKYFFFKPPILGEMIQFDDHIFQKG